MDLRPLFPHPLTRSDTVISSWQPHNKHNWWLTPQLRRPRQLPLLTTEAGIVFHRCTTHHPLTPQLDPCITPACTLVGAPEKGEGNGGQTTRLGAPTTPALLWQL